MRPIHGRVNHSPMDDGRIIPPVRPSQRPPNPSPEFRPAGAAGYFVWPPVWLGDNRPTFEFLRDTLPRDAGDFFKEFEAEVQRCELGQNVVVRMHRDGLVVFDFRAAVGRLDPGPRDYNGSNRFVLRQQLLNAHNACLMTAVHESLNLALTLATVEYADVLSMGTPESGAAFGAHSRAPYLYLARFPSTYVHDQPLLFDWRMQHRAVAIPAAALTRSCVLLTVAMNHSKEDLIELVDLWQRSCASYSAMNFALSVVLAWTVCEVLLDRAWEECVDANRRRAIDGVEIDFIAANRRKTLLGRDYTSAIRIEVLSLLGVLKPELYERCNEARQARNSWLHEVRPINHTVAFRAVETAALMLRERSGVALAFGGGAMGHHEQPEPPNLQLRPPEAV